MSLVILYEIGKISRIESAQKFSSYCRLVKCERESGGKKYHGRNQKIGNPYLKWAIGEIIIHARRTSPTIDKYYERLINKASKKRAKSIMNHKFGVAIYYILKNKQGFDEKRFIQTEME
ncbi:MAG: IS110 family transposase [Melioribacteraceae bacterium]|nr:IS110 family transposase [Melioribacteraceae bacterium]